jgi:acetoin utilization deacetylase AcuC-like enzyme
VLAAVRAARLGEVVAPRDFGSAPLRAVHEPAYVAFLEEAHAQWRAAHRDGDAFPFVFPADRSGDAADDGASIDARLGRHCFATDTAITAGSWRAATAAANAALGALEHLHAGARAAFALCRPPGHHAGRSTYGGYCFLNNAAIAAQHHLDRGGARVAILDLDYHHGNGTQEIFYPRGEVLTVSLHADPRIAFPYFSGHARETGAGAGLGANLNLPLPAGTAWGGYAPVLLRALERIGAFAPELLIVSFGVDTYAGDPITDFGLATADYGSIGALLPRDLPVLVVLEGGYDLATIGSNVVALLAACDP